MYTHTQEERVDLRCQPEFHKVAKDGATLSAVRFVVLTEQF